MPAAMIDSETLGTTNDSVILTLGCVKFDPYSLEEPHSPLYIKIDIVEQQEKGRTIDSDTLVWWSKQSQEIQDDALGEVDRISMEETANQLSKFLVGVDKIWAQGPIFDIPMLESFYKMLGRGAPWQYWQIRDSRTVSDMGDFSAKTSNSFAHNALTDAFCQAQAVQQIYRQLGVVKKTK